MASISGQKWGRHRCADTPAPRGRVHCKCAANPSRFAGGDLCIRPPGWHSHLVQSHAGQAIVHGRGHEGHSKPTSADQPTFGPSHHDQRVTPVLTEPFGGNPLCGNRCREAAGPNYGFQTRRGLVPLICDSEKGATCAVAPLWHRLTQWRLGERPKSLANKSRSSGTPRMRAGQSSLSGCKTAMMSTSFPGRSAS